MMCSSTRWIRLKLLVMRVNAPVLSALSWIYIMIPHGSQLVILLTVLRNSKSFGTLSKWSVRILFLVLDCSYFPGREVSIYMHGGSSVTTVTDNIFGYMGLVQILEKLLVLVA
jgi:hypothetical protein